MATQDAPGIEFSVLPEAKQQHFRLLELPPEVLELLAAEDAPNLQLKSQENPPGHASEPGAVLCTPGKTYNLRQVNTSNSLFVAQLSDGPGDEIPKPRLEAISQSHFTLELQPAKDVSAATHVQDILPVYASTAYYQSTNPTSKAALFGNVPASDGECEQAWRDLACFELDGEALIPSVSVKVKVWELVVSAATADGIDLTERLGEKHLSALVDLSGGDWPQEVALAVLHSMCQSTSGEDILLDEKKCARSIGQALLRGRTHSTPMPKNSFMTTWADLLPEKWRVSAELSLLEGSCKLQDGGILFNDGASNESGPAAPGVKAPAEAKSALGAKRKWHEKFRASKKTA